MVGGDSRQMAARSTQEQDRQMDHGLSSQPGRLRPEKGIDPFFFRFLEHFELMQIKRPNSFMNCERSKQLLLKEAA